MIKVNIYYKPEEDAYNWWNKVCNTKIVHGVNISSITAKYDQKFINSLLNTSDDQQFDFILNYLKLTFKNIRTDLLQESWRKINDQYFKALSEATERPICSEEFSASLTTFGLAPYNPQKNWFMVCEGQSLDKQVVGIAHEILHLQFIRYYQDYCFQKGINQEQFEDIKEAMTVILNLSPFTEFMPEKDGGYEKHIKLRKLMRDSWIDLSDFKSWLNFVIQKVLSQISI